MMTIKHILKLPMKWLLPLGVGVIVLLVVLIQLLLPADRVLPYGRINGQTLGFQTKNGVLAVLNTQTQNINLMIDGEVKHFVAKDAGIVIDTAKTADTLPTITLEDKLIPGVAIAKLLKTYDVVPVLSIDAKQLEQFTTTLSAQLTTPAVDASMEIKDGALVLHDAISGRTVSPDLLRKKLQDHNLFGSVPIVIESTKTAPSVTQSQLSELQKTYDQLASMQIRVTIGDKVQTVDTKTSLGWLEARQDTQTKQWSIGLNQSALNTQVAAWNKEFIVPPGVTQINLVDDVEVSRKMGQSGRSLRAETIYTQIEQWLKKPTTEPIVLAFTTSAPKTVVTRTYTRSSTELQTKINAWIASHRGSYQVAVRELGGKGREALYNVSQRTVMASTYKIYLAFAAYHLAENGGLDLNAQLYGGRNIEQCIGVMIINSDNDCAVALGRRIGWGEADKIIAAAGFQDVFLNNYDANGNVDGHKLVNASAQATFLAQLAAGSLMNGTNTSKLMTYMKNQVYRSGIPAGSRGAVVADKVGFLDSYLHDVGIVYGKMSTYALVIMSEGSSWSDIKELAQAIYDFMNE